MLDPKTAAHNAAVITAHSTRLWSRPVRHLCQTGTFFVVTEPVDHINPDEVWEKWLSLTHCSPMDMEFAEA